MKNNDLVIFGASPFIDQIDVKELCNKYTTLGFNHFGINFQVDYLFMYDKYIPDYLPTQVYVPHHFNETGQHIHKFVPKPGPPLYPALYQGDLLCLGVKYFTVSCAMNWAILQDFKNIYLVGIDHKEVNGYMDYYSTYEGPGSDMEILSATNLKLKEFIYQCQRPNLEIYQTNPEVKDQWFLPFKDVNELYV